MVSKSYRERHPDGAPHCEARILHAPGECEHCDMFPDWQLCRERWGIAFTGHTPTQDQHPCPADVARPNGHHQRWGGNQARPSESAIERQFQAMKARILRTLGN